MVKYLKRLSGEMELRGKRKSLAHKIRKKSVIQEKISDINLLLPDVDLSPNNDDK